MWILNFDHTGGSLVLCRCFNITNLTFSILRIIIPFTFWWCHSYKFRMAVENKTFYFVNYCKRKPTLWRFILYMRALYSLLDMVIGLILTFLMLFYFFKQRIFYPFTYNLHVFYTSLLIPGCSMNCWYKTFEFTSFWFIQSACRDSDLWFISSNLIGCQWQTYTSGPDFCWNISLKKLFILICYGECNQFWP